VTRNIDNPHGFAVWQGEPAKTKVDGHFPFTFLAQAVGMDAGQRRN
jgi:hypothetical protein